MANSNDVDGDGVDDSMEEDGSIGQDEEGEGGEDGEGGEGEDGGQDDTEE